MSNHKEKNQLRIEVMRLYNSIKSNHQTASEAMRQAWKVAKAKQAMKKGEAILTFFKKGEDVPVVRFGTLSSEFITYETKGTGRKKNAAQIAFFDLEAKCFKSFIASNLVQARAVA